MLETDLPVARHHPLALNGQHTGFLATVQRRSVREALLARQAQVLRLGSDAVQSSIFTYTLSPTSSCASTGSLVIRV